MGGPSIFDVVVSFETFKALHLGIVDVLGIGNELRRRRRSVGSRHFKWRTGR